MTQRTQDESRRDTQRDEKITPTEERYPPQECEVCGTVMYGLHCKIVCPNCGYRRDCSDP